MKTVWSIAGSDSLGCSGIQNDIRAAHVQGVHCSTIVTCTTAQNHQTCKEIKCSGYDHIISQWHALKQHSEPDAIKIGMIASSDALSAVLEIVSDCQCPIVFDPIFSTSTGFANTGDISTSDIKKLVSRASILTPNLNEASALLTSSIQTADEIRQAARDLKSLGCSSVLIKGGHAETDEDSTDYFSGSSRSMWLTTPRIDGEFRGTGCYLSTAIACGLARGLSEKDAVIDARIHLMEAMDSAYKLGEKNVLNEQKIPDKNPTIDLEPFHFPSTGNDPLGFYPIVPNTAWLRRLLPSV